MRWAGKNNEEPVNLYNFGHFNQKSGQNLPLLLRYYYEDRHLHPGLQSQPI